MVCLLKSDQKTSLKGMVGWGWDGRGWGIDTFCNASKKSCLTRAGNPARRCRLSFLKIFECESKSITLWCFEAVKLDLKTIYEDPSVSTINGGQNIS